jgi:hypothetical protein
MVVEWSFSREIREAEAWLRRTDAGKTGAVGEVVGESGHADGGGTQAAFRG